MSSVRFPGKMLAPFRGRPLIAQVLERFREFDLHSHVVVLTSVDLTDDPLADFVANRCAVPVFRGDLDNVVVRFQSALAEYPCDWFVRISGDSPLIDASLVYAMMGFSDREHDVVSNVVRRTFPPGQSVECVRSDVFRALDSNEMTRDQREHVTKVFYDRPHDWRMLSVICEDPDWARVRMVVDQLDDLRALEAGVAQPASFGDLATLELGMTRQLGIAVIGLGIGEQHARMYATLPSCKVKLLVDLDRSRAVDLARAFPGCDAGDDLDNVLDRDDIDLVSIASFDDAHFDQVMRSLSAGKHVFVEKPLCRTAKELAQIRTALNTQSSLHLASNLVLRGADLYRWLRNEIAAGAFGDIYAFDGDYLYGRLHKITEGWRGDTDNYSVMLGGGIHMIDLMLWLTGERPLSVHALGNRICTRDTGFQYDDFTAATLTFASGMVGRITANFGCVHRHQHVVRIFGTRKTFILDDAGPRLMTGRDPVEPGLAVAPVEPICLATKPAHKGALIPAFIEGIVLNKPSRTAELDATLDAIAIAAACDEAVSNSSPIQIRY